MKTSDAPACSPFGVMLLTTAALLLSCLHVPGATLTGVILFSSTQAGAVGGCIWDTSAEGGFVDLKCFHDGIPINDPPNHKVPIAATLHAGTNVILVTAQPDPIYNYFIYQAVNLYFDGHVLPDISLKGPVCGTPTPCSFTSNTAPTTISMQGATVPSSPRFDYVTPADKVTVVDYQMTPGYNGVITLVVEPTLELLNVRVSQVEITWPSLTGLNYQVQYASSLTSNIFQPIGSPIPGSGTTNSFRADVPLGEPQRFYRVFRTP